MEQLHCLTVWLSPHGEVAINKMLRSGRGSQDLQLRIGGLAASRGSALVFLAP